MEAVPENRWIARRPDVTQMQGLFLLQRNTRRAARPTRKGPRRTDEAVGEGLTPVDSPRLG
jgi:hypothetical protein